MSIQQSRLLAQRSSPATVIISRILGNNQTSFVAGKRARERKSIPRRAIRRRGNDLRCEDACDRLFESRSGTRATQDAFRESRKLNKVPTLPTFPFCAPVALPRNCLILLSPVCLTCSSSRSPPFPSPIVPFSFVVPDKFAERDSSPSVIREGKGQSDEDKRVIFIRSVLLTKCHLSVSYF